MSREEQGCRAGRKPIEERLAKRDQERHDLRAREMKGATNWSTGKGKGK